MAVTQQTPRNVSTATAGATVFPYDFKIITDTDLMVSVDGVAKTVDVDFTLTGVGSDTGGDVTFLTPLVGGESVVRRRNMAFQRLTDFQTLGDLRADTLNNDQDAPVLMIQQLAALAFLGKYLASGEFVWDAEGHRIINLGDASADTDAVNLRTLLQKLGDYTSLGLNTDPRFWEFTGDGTETVFYLPGADVSSPLFYDVYVAGVAIEPTDGYAITIAADTTGSFITFTTAPANLAECWVVLRGYAKPFGADLFNNQTFLDLLQSLITNTFNESSQVLELGALRSLIPLADVSASSATVDGSKESYLLRCTNGAATTLTVRANDGTTALDWATNPQAAPYFSVVQRGAGQVTVQPAAGVTITTPTGYLPKTRTAGSVITLTGDYIAGGQWICSGDMALA